MGARLPTLYGRRCWYLRELQASGASVFGGVSPRVLTRGHQLIRVDPLPAPGLRDRIDRLHGKE